ncbi:MAG: protein kinase [Acidobacteriota bacterium]|nr:protein kinase [Acidobacteriota bacterium]
MAPENWDRVETIYHAAKGLKEDERASFLAKKCGSNNDLRREVESLLAAAEEEPTQFLNANAEKPALPKTSFSQSLVGTQIGNYKILSPLGAGGMGEVLLANDARLDRKVAIKILPAEFTRDASRLERFEREARAASALNHPNILTIYEIGSAHLEFGETHFIATEFIEGRTLRQMMDSPLGIHETLDIVIQVTGALSAAHQAGIVHRDIKPENLMIRPDGFVKVLDFGLAKLNASQPNSLDSEVNTLHAAAKTAPGMILGTLRYMSPEQARGLPVDARSDIFSLGVVIYEMLAGWSPFNGETMSDVIADILTSEPPPLTSVRSEIPAELQHIVSKTLRKKKEERYQSCQELLTDLKELKSELEFSAKLERSSGSVKIARPAETTPVPAPSTATATPRRFSMRHVLMMLPVAMVLLAVVWWFVGKDDETYSPASLKSVEVTSWPSAPGENYSVGSFSPDGKVIAFTSARNGSKNIWLKQTASGEAIQITKDEFANEDPIWSPDGDQIAFFSLRGNQPSIWRTPAFGGAPSLVATLPDGSAKLRRWSKDGATIFVEMKQNLFALDVRSQQINKLTDLDSAKVNSDSVSVSPDEQQVAYISTTSDGHSSVWIAPVRGGQPKQIASDAGHNRNTVWHPDSRRVFYSANVDGVYQIFLANVDGRKPAQITFGDINSFALDVSPDGARILYGSTKEESDIWKANVPGGEESALTSDLGAELWPEVSPDGKAFVYQAVRNLSQGDKISNSAILLKQANSDESSRLDPDGALPSWSPDGKQIAFMRSVSRTRSLWTINVASGQTKQLATDGLLSIDYTLLPYLRVQTNSFSWSLDSGKLVYPSVKNGQPNLWAVAADGSGNAQITDNNDPNQAVYCPLWSSDGKFIAYSSRLNNVPAGEKAIYSVWVTEAGTKTSKAVFQSDSFARLIGWPAETKDLILATFKGRASSARSAEVGLVRVSVATGEQRPIATLQSAYLYNIHLSADKKAIAFTSRQDGKDNIWIIPVSGGEAKRLTANNDPKLYFSSLAWSPDGRAIYFGKQSRHSLLSMITNFK